jgi:hypothetical protein
MPLGPGLGKMFGLGLGTRALARVLGRRDLRRPLLVVLFCVLDVTTFPDN